MYIYKLETNRHSFYLCLTLSRNLLNLSEASCIRQSVISSPVVFNIFLIFIAKNGL